MQCLRVWFYALCYVLCCYNNILEERRKLYPYYSTSKGEDEMLLCHVEQRAGEVLFVPSMWTHQILNLAESVGFAAEIHY
jgi:hypothetical protein